MITQHLNDPTIGDPVPCALDDHAFKFGFQGCQAGHATFYFGELGLGDRVGCSAGLIGIVRQAEKVADRLERKAKLACMSNEREPFMGLVSIEALISRAALSFWQ